MASKGLMTSVAWWPAASEHLRVIGVIASAFIFSFSVRMLRSGGLRGRGEGPMARFTFDFFYMKAYAVIFIGICENVLRRGKLLVYQRIWLT